MIEVTESGNVKIDWYRDRPDIYLYPSEALRLLDFLRKHKSEIQSAVADERAANLRTVDLEIASLLKKRESL